MTGDGGKVGLSGRVAIVTGGSSGIGRAIAGVLAQDGADVTIVARDGARLAGAADDLGRDAGRPVAAITADTVDQASVDAMIAAVIARTGRVDILVNCAANASGVTGSIETLDGNALANDLNVKVVGYARCIRAVAPAMKRAGHGRIICIGGFTGKTSDTLSGMRNAAVSHLCKTVADELGPFGITVNAVHPGLVRSPHLDEILAQGAADRGLSVAEIEAEYAAETPARRLLSPEEIAATVRFLASEEAAAIMGQSITVDGGLVRGIYL